MDTDGEGSGPQSLRRRFSSANTGDAESAAVFARGDGESFTPDAGDRACWAAERAKLIDWARTRGKLLPQQFRDPFLAPARGTEQLVYPSEDGVSLHKCFYVDERLPSARQMEQGMFGWLEGVEVKTRPASPAEAMARIVWFNRLYPQARIGIEGVDESGRIYTTQPFVDGRIAVSFDDMVQALANDGWETYFADPRDASTSTFYHAEANAYMTDVHEQNGRIVRGTDGKKRFQPFDVVIIVPPGQMES
jgi:hypothetical protein